MPCVVLTSFAGKRLPCVLWHLQAHRACHASPTIYKHVHKKHHRFRHPVGIAVAYAHPLEDVLVNTAGTVVGPVLLGSHLAVLWLYIGLKLWQSIDAHSGFNLPFPLSPFSALRYMDCAPAHDFHHSHNVGNFGGFFVFWDTLMGTDQLYLAHLSKNAARPVYSNVQRSGVLAASKERKVE